MPLPTPSAVQLPLRCPPVTLSRTTTAKSGPGLATANRWQAPRSEIPSSTSIDSTCSGGSSALRLIRVKFMSNRRAVFLDLAPLDQGDLDLAELQSVFDELTCHTQTDD